MHMVKIASNPKSETNVLKFNDIFIFFFVDFLQYLKCYCSICNVQCAMHSNININTFLSTRFESCLDSIYLDE